MNKRLLVVIGAVLSVLLLSSCFALRGFAWLYPSIPRGEKNVALLSLFPHFSDSGTDYPFIIVGLPKDQKDETSSLAVADPKKFDVDGRFGGPLPLQAAPDLAAAATSGSTCQEDGVALSEMTGYLWKAFRTENVVTDNGRVAREALTRLGIRSKASTDSGTKKIVFVSGGWRDILDPNGIPEAGEIDCTGMISQRSW